MSNEEILDSIVTDGTGIEVTQDEAIAAMELARADERESRWISVERNAQKLLRAIISADMSFQDVVIADLKRLCEQLIKSLPTPPKQ